ncbi:unnamed protein product [Protopolystoma xenopodis]|uniref:Uncharacterized protein n=1 Tax=Protopolystoma xenopodis TaxID=117903 RepID=A0A3S5CHB3_9PLAT|nr:unnamed protein product [Protopolystoma xenopodis]
MEEKRQKSNTTKEKSGVTLSDLKSAERTRPTDNPQTVESARLTPKGYNLISGKSQLEELLKPINYQDHNSDVNSDIIGPPPSFSKLRIASPTNKKGFSEDPALSSSQYTDFIAQLNLLRDQLARERIHVEQALGASLDAEEPEVYDPRLGEFPSKAGGTWGEWSDDDHTIVEMDKAKASRIFDSAVKSKSKSLRALASLSASNINQDANSSRDHPSANLDLIEKERNKFIRREQKTRDLEMQQREYLDAQDTYLAQINDELIKGSGKKSHHPRQNEIFSQIESDSKFVDLDSSMEFEDPRKKIQRDKTRIRPKKLSLSELEIVNSRRLALLGEGKRQESNRDNFDFSTGNETETDTSDPELVLNKFLSYQRDGKVIGSDD